MRHLDLAPQVRAVDDVARVILAGDESHRATQVQVHADPDFAIVQERHPGTGFRRFTAKGSEGNQNQYIKNTLAIRENPKRQRTAALQDASRGSDA